MLIIFDLDGTLIDSSVDLAISVNATRHNFRLAPLDQETVNSYVGEGAGVLVRRAMEPDASDARLAEALSFFLKFYRRHALEHTRLYDGVREAVEALAAQSHQLGVLTNKPEKISFDIIGALQLQSYFLRVYGGDTFAAKKPDPIGIRKLMEETGATEEETLMVGDSRVDVETARHAGVRSCGVLWGFQPETFGANPPDFVVETPAELVAAVAERFTGIS